MLALHAEGGMQFMAPLSLLFLAIISLSLYSFLLVAKNKAMTARYPELIRQLGMFSLAFGVFGTTVALFKAFGSLSTLNESLPASVIYGGFKVAMITALYGMIIFLFSLVTNMILRYVSKD